MLAEHRLRPPALMDLVRVLPVQQSTGGKLPAEAEAALVLVALPTHRRRAALEAALVAVMVVAIAALLALTVRAILVVIIYPSTAAAAVVLARWATR